MTAGRLVVPDTSRPDRTEWRYVIVTAGCYTILGRVVSETDEYVEVETIGRARKAIRKDKIDRIIETTEAVAWPQRRR